MEIRADRASTLPTKIGRGAGNTILWLFSEIKPSMGSRYSAGNERLRGNCRGIDSVFRALERCRQGLL
jgi:hypothetical protein